MIQISRIEVIIMQIDNLRGHYKLGEILERKIVICGKL